MKFKIYLHIAAVALIIMSVLLLRALPPGRLRKPPEPDSGAPAATPPPEDTTQMTTAAATFNAPPPAIPQGFRLSFESQDFAYSPLPLSPGHIAGVYRTEEIAPGVSQHFAWLDVKNRLLAALYLEVDGWLYLLDAQSVSPGDEAVVVPSPLQGDEVIYTCLLNRGRGSFATVYLIFRQGQPLLLCQIDTPSPFYLDADGDGITDIVATRSSGIRADIYIHRPGQGLHHADLSMADGADRAAHLPAPGQTLFRIGGQDRHGTAWAAVYQYNSAQNTLFLAADAVPGHDSQAAAIAANHAAKQQPILDARRPGIKLSTLHAQNISPQQVWAFAFGGDDIYPLLLVVEVDTDGQIIRSQVTEVTVTARQATDIARDYAQYLAGRDTQWEWRDAAIKYSDLRLDLRPWGPYVENPAPLPGQDLLLPAPDGGAMAPKYRVTFENTKATSSFLSVYVDAATGRVCGVDFMGD